MCFSGVAVLVCVIARAGTALAMSGRRPFGRLLFLCVPGRSSGALFLCVAAATAQPPARMYRCCLMMRQR